MACPVGRETQCHKRAAPIVIHDTSVKFSMETIMTDSSAVNYMKHGTDLIPVLEEVENAIGRQGFDPMVRHLVKLRASQINGCGFCVKMHTREAREDGETNDRLDRLVVWRHVDDFTPDEKAALAWTEALTLLKDTADFGALRAELRAHFTDSEITTLTAIVGMINLWNRIQVSNH